MSCSTLGSASNRCGSGACFLFITLILLADRATSFTTRQLSLGRHAISAQPKPKGQFIEKAEQISPRRTTPLSMFIEPIPLKTEKKNGEPKKDPLTEFKVGSVVRVVAEDLKAFQVPPKAYGSFNSKKKFVPAPEGGDRKTQNLVLPVGLRGIVTRIYNDAELSANFPVQVKFIPGEHVEEGFDSPVQFMAHLSPKEVEVV